MLSNLAFAAPAALSSSGLGGYARHGVVLRRSVRSPKVNRHVSPKRRSTTAVLEHLPAVEQLHHFASLDVSNFAAAAHVLLSDAATAAGAAGEVAAEEVKGGGGLWGALVGLWGALVGTVETSLVSMHDVLRGTGVPGAYGVTIILFTVIIKVVTFPLNYKQMESTMKVQALNPRVKKLQADYKDNPQVRNQMIAQLYEDEQINPLAGFLPVLIQIPVWIALYRCVLNLAKENLLDERFLFLPSLQGPVSETGLSLSTWLFPLVDGAPPIGWHDALCYLILPVILVISQFYSQKLLQPPNQDPSAAQANAVLKFMPLLIGWFSLSVPSGLGVYWVTNNLVSTVQTVFIRSRFDSETAAATSSGSASSATIDVSPTLPTTTLEQADGFNAKKAARTGGSKSASKKKRRKRR